jgi:predicted O-linked N-acetylglucosamine transferase (SPINDLY family)
MSGNTGQRAFHNARNRKAQKAEAAQLLERAVALHRTGLLSDAKAVYRQLLKLAPKHFDALYLLGMSEYQARNYHEAELLLGKAVDVEPRSAKAHLHRGVVLHALQRFEEAGGSYRRAIALEPGHAVALNNLGSACWMLNRLDQAIENFDRALAVKPDFPAAWYHRALVLHQLRRYDEALASHDRALACDPGYADALNARGSTLRALGRHGEALDSYDRALAINPDFAEALNNRGNILRGRHRFVEARDSFDRALAIHPDFAEALNGRGGVLTNLRDYDGAMASFGRALAVRPDYAEALCNRATASLELKRFDEAMAGFDRALMLSPGLAEAWVGRGNALHQSKRNSEAIACCERALLLEPKSHRAHALLGQCLAALGRVDEAIARFDDALAIKPDFEEGISLKIFVSDFRADLTFVEQRDVRQVWWERVGSRIEVPPREPHDNVRDPKRRLVVGYVSADFRAHSAARVFRPVLQYSDKTLFETICYSCALVADEMTEEFRRIADRWRDASQWTDDRLADQIRQDEVDILIDLSGHTGGNRLGTFVRKPAPIQAHGWGHGTPPGLPAIDYVFCDPVTIPPEVRHLFRERIYDLPCMLTLESLPADTARAELPALANGFVTFGVFNRISKISDVAAEVWAQILDRLPGSKLLIKDAELDDPLLRDNLLARFARYGVAGDRLGLLGKTSRPDHLEAMNKVDIALDPFPQNGGASTWEALQMGVPVVASLGDALSSRAAGGILSAVGMQDWVADSAAGYIEIAVAHASAVDQLANLRRALPGRIAASPAGNPAVYASEVGKAYRNMWRIYCAGEADRGSTEPHTTAD